MKTLTLHIIRISMVAAAMVVASLVTLGPDPASAQPRPGPNGGGGGRPFIPSPPVIQVEAAPPTPTQIPFIPPPANEAFTPPIVVPTDVTSANISEMAASGTPALAGIHMLSGSAWKMPDDSKGSPDGIIVKAAPQSEFQRPSRYAVELKSGCILVSVRRPTAMALISTPLAEVTVAADGDVAACYHEGILRVMNTDGRGDNVKIKLSGAAAGAESGKIVAIRPGFELVTGDHVLQRSDLRPADGIARRQSKLLEQGYLAISQFSVQSFLNTSELVADLNQSVSGSKERRIVGDMSKMAAVLNYVNGSQGFMAEAKTDRH